MKGNRIQLKTVLFLAVILLISVQTGTAQEVTGPHEIRWLRVGDLHNWYSNAGAEVEYGRRTRAAAQATDQTDQLCWEAQYPIQDRCCAKAIWIGCTNYNDPVSGEVYSYKVVQAGPRFANTLTNFMPVTFKLIGKQPHSVVSVDGVDATDNTVNDVVDEYDPDMAADRMVYHVMHTNMGITVTRKAYAFSHQDHDNYFIYDYVFKNTGIVDKNGTQVDQTLTDVIFHFQYRYAPGFEAGMRGWGAGGNINWGRNTVLQTIGLDPEASNFSMRAQYAWYGPHSQSPGYESDWGAPNHDQGGPLGAPAFVGVVTIHADKSAQNQNDDPYQPFTTQYIGADASVGNYLDSYNSDQMTQQYELMNAGHPDKTMADDLGDGFADQYGDDAGGYIQAQGFGPYTLAPGDSIHIVLAEAVDGITRVKSIEIGDTWFEGTGPFEMPDGSTTNDRNEYKKAWVWTAEDSILQTFERAIENYESGFSLPAPPPSPEVFEVNSGGDRILLSWADNATSWPNFDGYQIYRAISRPDTTYELLESWDASNAVHSYADVSARRGFDYYYYIVTKDDGSTNNGVPLVSSKFNTITNTPAYLRRPAVTTTLDSIRVVPNPFHISARTLQFDSADRIAFFGLPPVCTIKIYTERGDLIYTIDHSDGSGDELWDSLTTSRQIVVSGLYIAYIETPDGESAVRKFVIIR